jgi:hypothetical protein
MRGSYLEDRAQRPVAGDKGSGAPKKRDGEEDQKTQEFKGLTVWEKAHALTLDIYKISQTVPKTEIYGLVSQLQRAAVSIPANVAEGYAKSR